MADIPSAPVESEEYFSANAFLVFVDIKNSSTYGQYYHIGKYARLVDVFKKKFNEITTIFFKNYVNGLGQEPPKIECRGDEGFICLMMSPTYDDKTLPEFARKILSYIHILKASLYVASCQFTKTPIDIAVGIHFGEIAKLNNDKDICGYSINFTKRIESESRNSHHTGIFVSKEVKEFLRNSDVIFDEHFFDINNSNKNEKIYEIQYSFIDIAEELEENENIYIIEMFKKESPSNLKNISFDQTLLISLYTFFVKQEIEKDYFEEKLNKMLWHDVYEKNPTILLLRGRYYEKDGANDHCSYLSAIRYYKQALNNYPSYTRPAIEMSRLLNKMSGYCTTELAESTAIAHDLISKFKEIIKDYEPEIRKALGKDASE